MSADYTFDHNPTMTDPSSTVFAATGVYIRPLQADLNAGLYDHTEFDRLMVFKHEHSSDYNFKHWMRGHSIYLCVWAKELYVKLRPLTLSANEFLEFIDKTLPFMVCVPLSECGACRSPDDKYPFHSGIHESIHGFAQLLWSSFFGFSLPHQLKFFTDGNAYDTVEVCIVTCFLGDVLRNVYAATKQVHADLAKPECQIMEYFFVVGEVASRWRNGIPWFHKNYVYDHCGCSWRRFRKERPPPPEDLTTEGIEPNPGPRDFSKMWKRWKVAVGNNVIEQWEYDHPSGDWQGVDVSLNPTDFHCMYGEIDVDSIKAETVERDCVDLAWKCLINGDDIYRWLRDAKAMCSTKQRAWALHFVLAQLQTFRNVAYEMAKQAHAKGWVPPRRFIACCHRICDEIDWIKSQIPNALDSDLPLNAPVFSSDPDEVLNFDGLQLAAAREADAHCGIGYDIISLGFVDGPGATVARQPRAFFSKILPCIFADAHGGVGDAIASAAARIGANVKVPSAIEHSFDQGQLESVTALFREPLEKLAAASDSMADFARTAKTWLASFGLTPSTTCLVVSILLQIASLVISFNWLGLSALGFQIASLIGLKFDSIQYFADQLVQYCRCSTQVHLELPAPPLVEEGIEALEAHDSSSSEGGALAAISGMIGAAVFGAVPDPKSTMRVSSALRMYSPVRAIAKDVFGMVKNAIDIFPVAVQVWLREHIPSIFAVDMLDDDLIRQFIKRSHVYHTAHAAQRAMSDLNFQQQVIADWAFVRGLQERFLETTDNETLKRYGIPRIIKEAYDRTQKAYDAVCNATGLTTGRRMTPFCVWLGGTAGVGKSQLCEELVYAMMPDDAIPMPEKESYESDEDYVSKVKANRQARAIYTRNPGDDFWSGYCGQFAVVWDDFGQQNAQVTGSNEGGEFISIVGPNPFMLNMADLSHKGMNFSSQAVIVASNQFWPQQDEIKTSTALFRRRHIMLEVLVKPEYTQPGPNGVPIIDVNLIDISERSLNEHYIFIERDPFTPGSDRILGQYSYHGLICHLRQRFIDHRAKFGGGAGMTEARIEKIQRLRNEVPLEIVPLAGDVLQAGPLAQEATRIASRTRALNAGRRLREAAIDQGLPQTWAAPSAASVLPQENDSHAAGSGRAMSQFRLSLAKTRLLGSSLMTDDNIINTTEPAFEELVKESLDNDCYDLDDPVFKRTYLRDRVDDFSAWIGVDVERTRLLSNRTVGGEGILRHMRDSFNANDVVVLLTKEAYEAKYPRKTRCVIVADAVARRANLVTAGAAVQTAAGPMEEHFLRNRNNAERLHSRISMKFWPLYQEVLTFEVWSCLACPDDPDARRKYAMWMVDELTLCQEVQHPVATATARWLTRSALVAAVSALLFIMGRVLVKKLTRKDKQVVFRAAPDELQALTTKLETVNPRLAEAAKPLLEELAITGLDDDELRDGASPVFGHAGRYEVQQRRRAQRQIRARAHAGTREPYDSKARDVSRIVANNLCIAWRRLGENGTYIRGLFIGGRTLLLTAHFFFTGEEGVMPENTEFVLKFPDGTVAMQRFCRANLRVVHDSQGKPQDLVVYKCGANVQPFRNILSHICPRSQHRYVVGHPATLVSLENNKDFTPYYLQVPRLDDTDADVYNRVDATGGKIHRFRTAESYSYTANLGAGDCGSIGVVQNNNIESKIVSFHIAGNSNTCQLYGAKLVRESIQDAWDLVESEPIYPPTREDIDTLAHQGEPPGFIVDGCNFSILGKVRRTTRAAQRTEIRPSPIHGRIAPPIKAPSALSDRDPRILPDETGHRPSPMKIGSAKFGRVSKALSETLVSEVSDALTHFLCQVLEKPPVVDPDWDMVLNGDKNWKFFDSLNINTSLGYPYVLEKTKGTKGKEMFFLRGLDDRIELTPAGEEFMVHVKEQFARLHEGQKLVEPFQHHLKDELRSIAKVQAGKTRVFTGANACNTILDRKLFHAFRAQFIRANVKVQNFVGADVLSRDFHDLAMHLLENSSNLIDADYKDFDGSLHPQVLAAAVEIMDRVMIFWGEESHSRARRTMGDMILHSISVLMDGLQEEHCGNPSGCGGTTIINILANMIYMFLAWRWLVPASMQTFQCYLDHVRPVFYGDDMIMSVSDQAIPFYNFVTIRDVMAENLDLSMTQADKLDREDRPFKRLDECTFLKCAFHQADDGIWEPRHDYAEIVEMSNWTVVSEVPELLFQDRLTDSLHFMAFYPRNEYNRYRNSLIRETNKVGLKLIFPSFEELRARIDHDFGRPPRSHVDYTKIWGSTLHHFTGGSDDDTWCAEHWDRMDEAAYIDVDAHSFGGKGVTWEIKGDVAPKAVGGKVHEINTISQNMAVTRKEDWRFQDFPERENVFLTVNWTKTDPIYHILHDVAIPSEIITQPNAQTAFRQFLWFRTDVEIGIKITAMALCQGVVRCFYVPYGHELRSDRLNPVTATLNDGFYVDVSQSHAKKLFIRPMIPLPFMDTTMVAPADGGLTPYNYGLFVVMVMEPLQGVQQIQLTFTARLLNSTFAIIRKSLITGRLWETRAERLQRRREDEAVTEERLFREELGVSTEDVEYAPLTDYDAHSAVKPNVLASHPAHNTAEAGGNISINISNSDTNKGSSGGGGSGAPAAAPAAASSGGGGSGIGGLLGGFGDLFGGMSGVGDIISDLGPLLDFIPLLDTPAEPAPGLPTFRIPAQSVANVAGVVFHSDTLDFESGRQRQIDPAAAGADRDETYLAFMRTAPTAFRNFRLNTSDTAGLTIFSMWCTPVQFANEWMPPGTSAPDGVFQPTALEYSAIPFYQWHGDLYIQLKFWMFALARARLVVILNYAADGTNDPTDLFTSQTPYIYHLEIDDEHRDFVIKMPYQHARPFLHLHKQHPGSVGTAPTPTTDAPEWKKISFGRLTIQVENPLIVLESTTITSIGCQVFFHAGPDMQFNGLGNRRDVGVTATTPSAVTRAFRHRAAVEAAAHSGTDAVIDEAQEDTDHEPTSNITVGAQEVSNLQVNEHGPQGLMAALGQVQHYCKRFGQTNSFRIPLQTITGPVFGNVKGGCAVIAITPVAMGPADIANTSMCQYMSAPFVGFMGDMDYVIRFDCDNPRQRFVTSFYIQDTAHLQDMIGNYGRYFTDSENFLMTDYQGFTSWTPESWTTDDCRTTYVRISPYSVFDFKINPYFSLTSSRNPSIFFFGNKPWSYLRAPGDTTTVVNNKVNWLGPIVGCHERHVLGYLTITLDPNSSDATVKHPTVVIQQRPGDAHYWIRAIQVPLLRRYLGTNNANPVNLAFPGKPNFVGAPVRNSASAGPGIRSLNV